jgi:hypothetical protein
VAEICVEFPDLRIDFVGGDTPMEVTGGILVGEEIRKRVTGQASNQFRFHGSRDTDGVASILAGACAAIVPSRWENFPYSCIESMASGLPVIVSPNGGMRELVSDGVSGWIASDPSVQGLVGALRRALASSGPERERMGQAARSAVSHTCDNAEVVRKHLQLKDRLIRDQAGRSTTRLSGVSSTRADIHERNLQGDHGCIDKIGVVVSVRPGATANTLVASLGAHDLGPSAICVVDHAVGATGYGAEMSAAKHLLHAHPSLAAIAFLDARVNLDGAFLSTCATALEQEPSLGMVGAWMLAGPDADHMLVPPLPARPDLGWEGNFETCVVVRAEALAAAIHTAGDIRSDVSRREILDHVTTLGWGGLTYPAALVSSVPGSLAKASFAGTARMSLMARAMRSMHAPLVQRIRESSRGQWQVLGNRVLREPAASLLWLGRWLRFRMAKRSATRAGR